MAWVKAQKVIFKDEGEKVDKQDIKEVVDVSRLRRITGYVVPNISRWNQGKKAELKDRVKHAGGVSDGCDRKDRRNS